MKVNGVVQIVFFAAASSLYADTAKFTALVIDDGTDMPMSGVVVRANFKEDIGWRAWTESPRPDVDVKETGRDGRCRLTGKTNCGDVCCWVPEPPKGYYAGRGWGYGYKEKNLFGVWQPDNLMATIRLQRVEHPIPLFVKVVSLRDKNGRLGGDDGTNAVLKFDFMVGDWLPPQGNGRHADMIIQTEYKFRERVFDEDSGVVQRFYDFTNAIEFMGEDDGLSEKSFADLNCGIKFRVAPANGYSTSKVLCFGRRRKKTKSLGIWPDVFSDSDGNRCYTFRIRSRHNDNGELIEAYYGKIYGDFEFEGDDKKGLIGVKFLYYLNPKSLDRNLEWDMKTNLCPNPGSLGQPQP